MNRSSMRGVTLLELMVVVVIVAVLASIAIPSYRQYLLRAQRTDATGALLRLAAAQEKFYLQNNRYATGAAIANAPPNGLGITGTEHGYYTLDVVSPSGNAAVDYLATATFVAGGPQAEDHACTSFSITETGRRSATDSGNAVNTEKCWR